MKRKNIALRIINFLREHGGIREVSQVKFAGYIKCHHSSVYTTLVRLKENRVVMEIDKNKNLYVLNESFISVAEIVVEYLSKYPEGAPINAKAFSQNKGMNTMLLGIVLQKFNDLGVVCLIDKISVKDPPEYKLLVEDSKIWRDLFEPKTNFILCKKLFHTLDNHRGCCIIFRSCYT